MGIYIYFSPFNVRSWHIAAIEMVAHRHGVSGSEVQILSCRPKIL